MSTEKIKEKVLDSYNECKKDSLNDDDILLNTLHSLQKEFDGYIPLEAAEILSELMDKPTSRINEVLTFYTMLSTKERGKYIIRVCKSLPCHVANGEKVINQLKKRLKIDFGETTEDGLFTLEQSSCLGLCGVSPVMLINDEAYGNLTPEKVDKIIDKITEEERGASK
ncbi:MAG: NAD(P)H-dependent oxidoreductase subunit E [Thermotogota bacterium]|nr:NAD(P)H-dependent oxidoreductase subunit E [Thermotogota bacterium]